MNMLFKQYWSLLVSYLRPQRSRVMRLALLLLGSIGLQLINPQVIRYFIDTAQTHGSQAALLNAALLFMLVALAQRAISLLADYMATNVGWTATNAVRKDLTLHCLRLDMSFHKQRTPGELIERIDGDVTALANFFSQFIIRVSGNALLVIGIFVLLVREDVRVAVGLALYTLMSLFVLGALQPLATRRFAAASQARAEQYGFIEERISGTEDIRASGAEPYVMNRLYGLMRGLLKTNRAAWLIGSFSSNLNNFLFVVGYALGLALGAYLYIQGQATVGTAYLIVYYCGMLAVPLQHIREQARDLQQATASIQRVQELFHLQPEVKDIERGSAGPVCTLLAGALSAEFDAVSFRYEGNDNVLNEVSFHLQPGKIVGVLGRTGSGKTTLTRLLSRLYDPSCGVVRLHGVDIRALALAELRTRVGMVTQDVQLFQATVRDNLTFFNKQIGDEQIEQVLKSFQLWEWLRSLPAGLDSELTAGGQGLSAGEAQLLAFTRVFLKNPGLVILDEASSRLDPASEALLERAIDRLFACRTGIIIAHRLRTVQRADDILILENGRVVEYGPRVQLASDPHSRFYRLLQTGLEEALV